MKVSIAGRISILAVAALLCIGPAAAIAQSTAPDNTRQNKQASPTADQQTNNKADIELAKNVRRAITKDSSLSTNAHNVKVVAEGGHVTLTGPVDSEQEKQAVTTKATEVAGQGNVVDQLSVASPKQ